jgi:predicted GTPase
VRCGADSRHRRPRYPPALAGPHYPAGIPIEAEAELPRLIRERAVDRVVFAYSDLRRPPRPRRRATGAELDIIVSCP